MIIDIYVLNNRSVRCKQSTIGKTFENKATTLRFHLTEEMKDKDVFIEFEKPNLSKYITSKLEVSNNEEIGHYVDFEISNSLLDLKGYLKLEVTLITGDEVWKSETLNFNILSSINASEDIPKQYPNFVIEAQRVIDAFKVDGAGNSFLADDGKYKSMQEIAGGIDDFEKLKNKPQINSVELSGNKTFEKLGINEISNTELDSIFSDL